MRTEPLNSAHVVRDQNNGPAIAGHFRHFPETTPLKLNIAHSEHLINKQNLRV